MNENPTRAETPHTDAFRQWLKEAIEAIGITPATLARAVGAGVNTVGAFLRDPARDITLSRAADLERYLRKAAKDAEIELPVMRRALAASGASNG